MKTIYKLTPIGWIKVRSCQSFEHACKLARQLRTDTGVEHCVNS